MPAGTVTGRSKRKRRTRSRKPPLLFRFFQLIIKMMMSPVLLLWDSFRREETPDKTWLYSFFLFTTLVMLLAGAGVFFSRGLLWNTVAMMSAATADREILPGDVQAEIALINKYALRHNLDPLLIYALVKTVSDFQARAVSPAGARGLMQITPQVWRRESGSVCTGEHGPNQYCPAPDCIYKPEANLRVGTAYFQKLLAHYRNRVDLTLEAYNAGLSNVRPDDDPRYKETKGFLNKIVATWQNMRREALGQRLRLVMQMEEGVRILLLIALFCWLSLFWWAARKLFRS